MGLDEATEYWKENGSFEMLLVTDENEIYLTERIKNDFTLNENFSDMEIHVITK